MRPNQLLTRLRQDIRKMREAPNEERYLRQRHFALKKLDSLRAFYKAGRMTDAEKAALNDALNGFMAAARTYGPIDETMG